MLFDRRAFRKFPVLGGRFSLPFSVTFSNYSGSTLPSPWWNKGTWALSGGNLVNTPGVGVELVVNGNMETGDPPSSWDLSAQCTPDGVADERTGGAGAQSMDLAKAGGVEYGVYSQNVDTTAGAWYRTRAYLKNIDIDFPSVGIYNDPAWTAHSYYLNAGLTWALGRGGSYAEDYFHVYLELNAANPIGNGAHARYDDVSIKKLTDANLFLGLPRCSTANVVVKGAWNCGAGPLAGVAARLDNPLVPQNYVLGYYDWEAAGLIKCVNGTITSLIRVITAYSAGAYIEVRTYGSDVELWYDGVQIGATQAVADASILSNRYHVPFSTDDANSLEVFSIAAN